MVQSNYDGEALRDPAEKEPKFIFAQVMAAFIGTLLTLNVSGMISMITIVNGALKENYINNSTSSEDFTISDSQASLYGTFQLVSNLIASLLAGIIQDTFGRKKCLLISCVPQILSWVILFMSKNVIWLYFHALAVGIGSAFSEHVVITYISEIASIEWRGRLFSVGKFGYGVGAFVTFFLGNFYHWRKLAISLVVLPCILPFYISWLPESPLWLLSKGREEECRKSLMWLRGWTDSQNIEVEFQKLRSQLTQKIVVMKEEKRATHYIKLFTKPEFLEPFKISMCLFLSSFLLGLRPARFYFINTLNNLGVKADKMKIMTVTGIAGTLGCICLGLTIRKIGKRSLTLWTFSATAVCLLLMGVYSEVHSRCSFNAVWMIYILCAIIYCFGGYTLGGMPWFISSEIFPQRYRGVCTSIAGMFAHGMISILSHTYLDIEKRITITKVLHLYGIISLACCYYLYRNLPETENKSLHEIEEYFKNKKKKRNNDPDK